MTPAPAAQTPGLEPLRKRLTGKSPPRVVTAVGPEAWLRDETLRLVAETILGSAESPDLIVLRPDAASEGGAGEVLTRFFDEARTSSLFGGAKVVALRDADLAAKSDKAAFAAWLANPSSSVTVVLLATDFGADTLSAAGEAGVVVRCGGRGASGESPLRFAARQATAREKRLGPDEAELLVGLVGDDLTALENAVEVLSLHAGDEPAITQAAIRALLPGARLGDAEDFSLHVLDGDAAGALAAAARCFDEGVSEGWGSARIARDERGVAFALLRELARALQRVLDARRQLDAGVARHAVDMRLPPRLRDAAVRVASARRPETLDALVLLYEETDRAMKSGGPGGRVGIARLVTAAGRLK